MTEYSEYRAAVAAGLNPVTGAGRCDRCAFDTNTQGHRNGCPNDNRRR